MNKLLDYRVGISRAIAAYLANTSPNGEKIYPKDPKKRGKVDEMLYFDSGRLYTQFLDLYIPIMRGEPMNDTETEYAEMELDESLGMLEEYLTRNKWAAGDEMSIADLSLHATVTTTMITGHDMSKFPKIQQWVIKTKEAIPDYNEANQEGLDQWEKKFKAAKNTK